MATPMTTSPRRVSAVVVGAGNRGWNYSMFADEHPDRLKVVAVAEPRDYFRNRMKDHYAIPNSNVFKDWVDLAGQVKLADCAIVATPDILHKAPVVAMAKLGYHILVEKPMATTESDCEDMVDACKENGVMLAVCHVLRYMPHTRKLKQLIDFGVIGDLVNIQHMEPIGFWHYAHSYVRGNWRREEESSSSLLAKSCHDLDLISYWMGANNRCTHVSSFGSLNHFKKKNKPKGAGNRCLECSVENQCPYSAKKIYLESCKQGKIGWPNSVLVEGVVDIESLTESLRIGPYGRCVYECDNDVMDNQIVNLQFENGQTASFSMIAFSEKMCVRQVRFFGTKGELKCDFDKPYIEHSDFVRRETARHDITLDISSTKLSGHGGSDYFLMDSFISAVEANDPSLILTGPGDTLRSHKLVFAAERARKQGIVVEL